MNQYNIKLVLLALTIFTTLIASAKSTQSDPAPFPRLSVADFIAESDLRDVEISPNGRYLAMIVSENKARFVIIKDLETEGTPTIGSLGDIAIRPADIKWANNERLLIQLRIPYDTKRVRRDHKSKEDFDIYSYPTTNRMISVNINAKDPVVMLEGRKVASFVSHYLPDDPEHVLMPYYSSRSRYTLEKVNVYTGESEVHVSTKYRTYKIFTDGKGKPLYRLDYLRSSNETEIFKYTDEEDWVSIERVNHDAKDGREERIDSRLVYFGLSEDSSMVYRELNESTGFYEIVEVNKKNGTKKVIASSPGQDIVSLLIDTKSDKMIGYSTQKDLKRNVYFDSEAQQRYDAAVKQIGNNNLGFYTPINKSNKVIAITSGPDNPGYFYLYDTKTYKLSPIGPRYKKLSLDELGIPAVMSPKMRDGTRIRAYILFPPNYQEGKPMPMVVLPHGGPHTRDSARYDSLAQFIATRGYIVVQPNFRGSTGYGYDFKAAGFKQWGGLMQDDITDTVKLMIKQGHALKDKVCIVGGSYGGYAALMGVLKTPELYQCSISINGVTDLKEQIEYDLLSVLDKYREKSTKLVYEQIGHLKDDAKMLRFNSPTHRTKEINVPILFIAGLDDEIVQSKQSKEMVNKLKKQDKEVEYLTLKGAPHNVFYYIDQEEEVLTKIEEFLAKYLSD